MSKKRISAIENILNRPLSNEHSSAPNVKNIFGQQVFNSAQLQKKLAADDFKKYTNLIKDQGELRLDQDLADKIASAVKDWAIEKGATHFTHWFQPMTGATAEKHDSLFKISPNGDVVEKFSASQLIQSEPDASSFPSGGMRSTFEARGYTAWDPHSPMFIVEDNGSKVLCVPSVFVSYNGHSLDTKTGMMKSLKSLYKSVMRLLDLLGEKTSGVYATAGCEQEFFLIDEQFIAQRPDLLLTGRTLLGADPIKGQQLDDHYFGSINSRVKKLMNDFEKELYSLGIPVQTRHNEVAPSQFEMAPNFEEANLASDHQMLLMDVIKKVSKKHNYHCLLHEKPFAGINGSGKHVNWSLTTNEGDNLLDPGKTPQSNVRFLVFLSCVIRAVFKNQVALRAAIASHGNDHRLGANEAPPAILSVFLGETLTKILTAIESKKDLSKEDIESSYIDLGLSGLPNLPKDNTDRNRTSPFAFTGNKFEFRAVGSSQDVAFPITMVNAAVTESINEFCDVWEKTKKQSDSLGAKALDIVREFIVESKSILFEGDGYSQEWRDEAKSRGLYELLTTPQAFAAFSKEESHKLLIDQKIYTQAEVQSRINVRVEHYINCLGIEVDTAKNMVRQFILPSVSNELKQRSEVVSSLKLAGVDKQKLKSYLQALDDLVDINNGILAGLEQLENLQKDLTKVEGDLEKAEFISAKIIPKYLSIREYCDKAELLVSDEFWLLPRYSEMLFIS